MICPACGVQGPIDVTPCVAAAAPGSSEVVPLHRPHPERVHRQRMRIPDDVDVTFLTADCLLLSWGGARLGRVERPLGVPTWRAYASGGRRLDPDDGLPHHHLVELVLDAGGYIRSTT